VLPNPVRQKEEKAASAKKPSSWTKIISREAQILTCLINRMSSPEITDRFGISTNTIANQRASILRKASVKTTVDLIRVAL
jgi:DNA-binding CsgD family transcriptional regulator